MTVTWSGQLTIRSYWAVAAKQVTLSSVPSHNGRTNSQDWWGKVEFMGEILQKETENK